MSPKHLHSHVVKKNIVILVFFLATICLFDHNQREDAIIAQDSQSSASKPEMAGNSEGVVKKTESRNLVREGTVLQSQHVVFQMSSNRAILTTGNGSEKYTCLENQNLQRVTDVLRDNPTLTDWTVDFIVTEFRGANYALIQRAVLSSTSQRTNDQARATTP